MNSLHLIWLSTSWELCPQFPLFILVIFMLEEGVPEYPGSVLWLGGGGTLTQYSYWVPSRHDALTQCLVIVGPASKTVGQQLPNIRSMSRVFWVHLHRASFTSFYWTRAACRYLPNTDGNSWNILHLFIYFAGITPGSVLDPSPVFNM